MKLGVAGATPLDGGAKETNLGIIGRCSQLGVDANGKQVLP